MFWSTEYKIILEKPREEILNQDGIWKQYSDFEIVYRKQEIFNQSFILEIDRLYWYRYLLLAFQNSIIFLIRGKFLINSLYQFLLFPFFMYKITLKI